MSNLYNQIDALCKQNNTNITKICNELDLSRSSLSELKSGRTRNLSSESKKKIAMYFNIDMEYLDKEITDVPCPLCGLDYAPSERGEIQKHNIHHQLWKNAVKKFGFCWNWQYRENAKARARNLLNDSTINLSSAQKAECYEVIFKALFSRSLEANGYSLDCISFCDYVATLLSNKKNTPDEQSEEYHILVEKYGIRKGNLSGTYFITDNFTAESQEELLDKYNSVDPEILEKHNGDLDAAYEEQRRIDEQEARKQARIIVNTHNVSENPLKDEPSNISNVIPAENLHMIPVFASVSAGFGAYASDEILEYIPTVLTNPYEANVTLGIKVTGNSMYPKIEDGDTIVVRKQESVDSGSIAVILLDGEEGLVKKVKYGPDWIELISINPEYPVKHFEGSEVQRLRVVGLVRQVIKMV